HSAEIQLGTLDPYAVMEMECAQVLRRADRKDRRRYQSLLRRLRRVQGTVEQGRRRAIRQRMGVAAQRRWQAVDRQHAEPGQPADGREDADPWTRRLGARLLLEVSEPPPRLHRRVVERGELG